jgi:integrase
MPKTQQRQAGQIIPRGDRKWLIRVYVGQTADGKRRYDSKTVQGTYKQAETELTALKREKDTGSLLEPTKMTVQQWCEEWLTAKSRNLGEKTARDYQHRLMKDVYPFIGSRRLATITATDIDRLYGSLLSDRKLSPRTVRYTHSVLHQAMKRAVSRKYLKSNPCDVDEIELPELQRKEQDILTPDQVNALLDAAPRTRHPLAANLKPLWRLILTSGVRPQEALAVRWSDLQGNQLTIQRALVEVTAAHWEVRERTKTEDSIRTLTLPSSTIAELQEHRRQQLQGRLKAGPAYDASGDYIFATRTGGHLTPASVRLIWKKDLAAAGLPLVRLYDARHTHASHLLEAGGNVKSVAARLGHSNPNTTLRVYAHCLPAADSALADATEKLLARRTPVLPLHETSREALSAREVSG